MSKILNSRKFVVDKARKSMIAEASDLEMNQFPSVIAIKSHRTSVIMFFCHLETKRNNDNEIVSFVYEPMSESLNGWTVHIIND